MKKITQTPFVIAGTLVTGLTSTAIHAQAGTYKDLDANPFTISELSNGYMQTAESDSAKGSKEKMKDGACGEGKCGSAMMKGSEEKTAEGKCAGNKPMPKMDKKDMEGKCGEGKCGASMSK